MTGSDRPPPLWQAVRSFLFSRASLLLGGLLVPLVLLELGLRVAGYDPLARVKPGVEIALRATDWPHLRYELTPGVETFAWGTNVTVNTRGYRGPERPIVDGRKRIVVLGDSITFGNQLSFEATYPAILHRGLSPLGIDVINLGVSGYDTIQEVAFLKKRGLAERPDVVILGFCMNDAGIVSVNLEFKQAELALRNSWWSALRLGVFVGEKLRRRRLAKWQREMNDPESFRRRYAGLIDEIAANDPVRKLMAAVPNIHLARWYSSPGRVGRIRHGFSDLAQLSRERGFPVIVMIIPVLVQQGNEYPYRIVHEIVAYEARRAGLDVVDLAVPFLRTGMDSLRIDPKDSIHPNARGHEIIGSALEAYLRVHIAPSRTVFSSAKSK